MTGVQTCALPILKNDSGGLLQYATLYPCVDFQKLENVAVIINHREVAQPAATPVPTAPAQASAQTPAQPTTGDTK